MDPRRATRGAFLAALLTGLAPACLPRPAAAPPPDAVSWIPPGSYRVGSTPEERELGYALSPPAVRERGWYEAWEAPSHPVRRGGFWIDRFPVTQADYARFVHETGRAAPGIDATAYARQGFLVHPYTEVRLFLWRGGAPPADRWDHPAVLVDRADAEAYCAWRGMRLPDEEEWEAGCRGPEGRVFAWGDAWSPGIAAVGGSGTWPVTAHPDACTPDGVCDLGGNVFEWTRSTGDDGRAVLKGCSWDDAPGTCRCAFRHFRPPESRHILIGFRCVRDGASPEDPPPRGAGASGPGDSAPFVGDPRRP